MCFFFLSAQANSLSNEVTCRCVSETRLAQNKKLHLFFSLFVYFFFILRSSMRQKVEFWETELVGFGPSETDKRADITPTCFRH